jgi:hypothetical protein
LAIIFPFCLLVPINCSATVFVKLLPRLFQQPRLLSRSLPAVFARGH